MPELIQAPHIPFVLAASLLAAGTAWAVNGRILPFAGNKGITYLTPLAEELAKTLWALLLGAPILWTHVGFGFVEAFVELRRRGAGGVVAGWTALAAHTLFGYITVRIVSDRGFLAALLAATLAHTAWNLAVVYYSQRAKTHLTGQE
ncbi:MAG: hypothetical protein ACOY35_07985 [Bacillota bacterium]|nr:hypothetical protein [Bacillota bacterium]